MIRTKLAKRVLTKKEQKHLSENGVHSMASFLETRKYQMELQKVSGGKEPCFECKTIAIKLGID